MESKIKKWEVEFEKYLPIIKIPLFHSINLKQNY